MSIFRTDHNQVFDAEGNLISEEIVQVDVTAQTNKRTIQEALLADLAAMQAIIDDTNANINTNPAARLKTIARAQRRQIRLALDLYDGAD